MRVIGLDSGTSFDAIDAARRHGVTELVASGGGTRNPTLMAALKRHLPTTTSATVLGAITPAAPTRPAPRKLRLA